MSETKIVVNQAEGQGTSEDPIVILTGNALDPKYPTRVNIAGILSAPADFLERKKENYDPKKCHIEVNRLGGEIKFIMDEKLHTGDTVSGALMYSAAFTKFKINSGELWDTFSLASLIRQNKYWFASAEEHAEILKNLNSFTAKVQMKVEQHQNNSGMSKQVFEREVTDIAWKREFRLNMPIFEGYARKKFSVEIGVSPTDRNVRFFLESNEIYELVEGEKEKLIAQQVERFDAFGCSVVYLT